jgi:Leucine-rich repeat (LRR) protein
VSDEGCGVGQCLCGLCTLSCASEGCSAGPPGSECVQMDHFAHAGLCAGRVSEPICLSTCSDDAGCGAEQACVEGVCLSASTAVIAAAGRDAGAAPSLCATSSVVTRSLRVDNQAQLDALAGCERIEGDLTLELLADANAGSLASLRAITGVLRVSGARGGTRVPLFAALELVGGLHLSDLPLEEPPALPRLRTIQSASNFDVSRGGLSIDACSGLVDMRAFAAIEELDFLSVNRVWSLTSLEGLNGLRRLHSLSLEETGVTDLSQLARASGLRMLILAGNSALESLEGLPDGRELFGVVVARNERLASLRGLGLPAVLNGLNISENRRLETLAGLEGLRRARHISVSGSSLINLTGLDGLEQVDILTIHTNPVLGSLVGLAALREVGELMLNGNPALVGLEALARLESINWLRIDGVGLESLGIRPTSLRRLELTGTALTDFAGLEQATGLDQVILWSNTQLASLSGLPAPTATAYVQILDSPLLVDLGGLSQATALGSLELRRVGVSNLDALANLRQLTTLSINASPNLVHIDAVSSVEGLKGLFIADNPLLARLPELAGVVYTEFPESDLFLADISGNPSLIEGPAFPALERAGGIRVSNNAILPRLTGFGAVRQLDSLAVENNAALSELDFSALQSAESIVVRGHPLLTDEQVSSLMEVPASTKKVVSGTGRDPCPWLEDHVCDEQFADCAPGSDSVDCDEYRRLAPSADP